MQYISEADFKDRCRGCLMAGAVGDALGYPVEFYDYRRIIGIYGNRGITQFALSPEGKALVSDDTQMTLFTANGILMGITRGCMHGVGGYPPDYVGGAYVDWYYTQTGRKAPLSDEFHYTWLRDLPELRHRRAPGNTCLSACESLLQNKKVKNNSRGCGGIMRVAPMGLLDAGYLLRSKGKYDPENVAKESAEIGGVTHRHPLGYLSAGLLGVLVYELSIRELPEILRGFPEIVKSCIDSLGKAFPENRKYMEQLADLTRKALRLAEEKENRDVESIRLLGQGWTGEEAWAIAVYCVARHIDAPLDVLISAVNHDGDSDSTGSIAGNIIGAAYGYKALQRALASLCPPEKGLEETLELSGLVLTFADDLASGCIISEYESRDTPAQERWFARYCERKADMREIPDEDPAQMPAGKASPFAPVFHCTKIAYFPEDEEKMKSMSAEERLEYKLFLKQNDRYFVPHESPDCRGILCTDDKGNHPLALNKVSDKMLYAVCGGDKLWSRSFSWGIEFPTTVVSVVPFGNFFAALTSDGRAWVLSSAEYKESILPDVEAKAIESGCSGLLFILDRSGKVHVHGENADPQICREVGRWQGIRQISAGQKLIAGVREDGSVVVASTGPVNEGYLGWRNIVRVYVPDTSDSHGSEVYGIDAAGWLFGCGDVPWPEDYWRKVHAQYNVFDVYYDDGALMVRLDDGYLRWISNYSLLNYDAENFFARRYPGFRCMVSSGALSVLVDAGGEFRVRRLAKTGSSCLEEEIDWYFGKRVSG